MNTLLEIGLPINQIKASLRLFENINIDKFLIGNEMDAPLQISLSHVSDVEVYIYSYNIDGILFKRFAPLWERTSDELISTFKPTKASAIFHQGIIDMFLDILNNVLKQ